MICPRCSLRHPSRPSLSCIAALQRPEKVRLEALLTSLHEETKTHDSASRVYPPNQLYAASGVVAYRGRHWFARQSRNAVSHAKQDDGVKPCFED